MGEVKYDDDKEKNMGAHSNLNKSALINSGYNKNPSFNLNFAKNGIVE